MPANPKYLDSSSWQQFAKLSAGILGGYLISSLFHMNLTLLFDSKAILITSIFTLYIFWGALMIFPYLFKNGWKIWSIYFVSISILCLLFFLLNQHNPFL